MLDIEDTNSEGVIPQIIHIMASKSIRTSAEIGKTQQNEKQSTYYRVPGDQSPNSFIPTTQFVLEDTAGIVASWE